MWSNPWRNEAQRNQLRIHHSMMSGLLDSGRFSDLTMVCHGEDFHVHKGIVASRSPVIAKACEGPFEEGSSGRLQVEVATPETLARMLNYVYLGEYDDYTSHEFKYSADATAGEGKDDAETAKQKAPVTEKPLPLHRVLLNDARLFALAEYYDMKDLKMLSTQKFSTALLQWFGSGIKEVVAEVYSSTPQNVRELRDKLSNHAAEISERLVKTEEFEATMAEAGEFGIDYARALSALSRRSKLTFQKEQEIRRDFEDAMNETIKELNNGQRRVKFSPLMPRDEIHAHWLRAVSRLQRAIKESERKRTALQESFNKGD